MAVPGIVPKFAETDLYVSKDGSQRTNDGSWNHPGTEKPLHDECRGYNIYKVRARGGSRPYGYQYRRTGPSSPMERRGALRLITKR